MKTTSAALCHRTVAPHLDAWAEKHPGGAVVAYENEERVLVHIAPSLKAGESYRDNFVPKPCRDSCIVLQLTAANTVWMF